MAEEDALGRRQLDKLGTPSVEVLQVLIINVQNTLMKLEATTEKGFDRVLLQLDQMEKRVTALEGFRERVQERDRALAKAEGTFHLSWPAVAALISVVSIVVGVAVALLSGN